MWIANAAEEIRQEVGGGETTIREWGGVSVDSVFSVAIQSAALPRGLPWKCRMNLLFQVLADH